MEQNLVFVKQRYSMILCIQ